MEPNMSSTPLPPARRTLSLGAALVLALSLPMAPARSDEVAQERFEKTYELSGIAKVHIQNVNGVIRIETGEKDQLHVVAVKRVKGSDAEESLKQTEIRVTKTGDTSRSRRSCRKR